MQDGSVVWNMMEMDEDGMQKDERGKKKMEDGKC